MYDSPEAFDWKEEMGQIERIKFKQSHSLSIVPNLLRRELTGKGLNRINPFGEVCPERLRMPIEHIIPREAMEAGNIFMGFTECGRYLLSYTVRSTESDFGRFLWSASEDLTFEYKLHFWLFTPNTQVRKVCSVILFDNYGICHDNLLIEISQWKDDQTRLLVTGRCVNPALPHNSQQFVTITTIPSTKRCLDCFYAPPEEVNEEDFGGTVSPLLTTCLRHGLTVHLAHDQVQPFPRFNPDVMLRFPDSIVINTGNLFHIFTVKLLEPKEPSPFRQELLSFPPDALSLGILGRPATCRHTRKRQRHLRCDFWFRNCRNCSLALMPVREAAAAIAARLLDTSTDFLTDVTKAENSSKLRALESIQGLLPEFRALRFPPATMSCTTPRKRRLSQSSMDSEFSSSSSPKSLSPSSPLPEFRLPKRLESIAEIAERSTMLPPDGRKFFKRLGRLPLTPTKTTLSTPTPLTAYDIDIFEETVIDRSFSSFRKRRLADKKYEFRDGEFDSAENIGPLKLSRKPLKLKDHSASGALDLELNFNNENSNSTPFPRSPRGSVTVSISPAMSPAAGTGAAEILRPITNNSKCCGLPLMSPPMAATTATRRAGPVTVSKSTSSNPNAHPNFSTNLNCIAKVLRCYAEEDEDGALSVKTDTDDEYRQTLPFPVALQLKVHGSGYRPMNVISNSKSHTCPRPVLEVLQRSLDIEVLCNEVSGIMCLAAEKYYSSCFDYDVAIVDVCQNRGSITAVAFVLMTAMSLQNQNEKFSPRSHRDASPIPGLSDQKQKYEAMFSFIWEPIEERSRVLYMGSLKEIPTVPKHWHPTKRLVPHLRNRLYDTSSLAGSKTLRNDLAVKDWKSVDELTDAQGIVTLFRRRKPRRRMPGYFPSPALSSESSQGEADGSSLAGGTTSDEEDETLEDSWLY